MTAFGHSNFLQALGWAVLNSLWQLALLWTVFNLITSFHAVRSSQKSKWAFSFLLAGFAWFVYTFISIFINNRSENSFITVNGLSGATNYQLNSWLESVLPYASALYILLLSIPVWRYVRNYRYVQALRKYELSKVSVEWRMFVKRIATQLGIRRPVGIWISNLVNSPVTIGYLKPVILVPLAAVSNLTSYQMEAVLLHELAHIRRHDYLINLIINCIQTVLYFNPFVKAFVKTIERERERSCDEMVMQFQYDAHNYASALLLLEKSSAYTRQMAIAANGKNDLLGRIERILKVEKKNAFSFNKMAGLFAGLLCIIMVNALIIAGKHEADVAGFPFEKIGSPANFFSEDEVTTAQLTKEQAEVVATEHAASIDSHATTIDPDNNEIESVISEEDMPEVSTAPAIALTAVNNVTTVVPELTIAEQKHVAAALTATKKIIENAKWKEVEKTIADALTSMEKENVKQRYMLELEKLDWEKLEHKLASSYDQLNWGRINENLNSAVKEIKLDSLIEVYTIADQQLENLEREVEAKTDSQVQVSVSADISLEQIKQNKQVIKLNLEKAKAVRNKKIIHL